MTGATRALAGFATRVRFDALPASVVHTVLAHTLDQLGAAVVGATKPWNATVRRYALAESPEGRCTVHGSRHPARPEWAALANATAGHGFEIDDYALPALAHPGCVVVPVALALGEHRGVGGHELLAALTAGFEMVVRFGLATTPSLTSDRGFHVTGVHGVFGAAAVAGRLDGLDPGRMTSALSLAASQAGGVTEYTRTGGEVKRLHAGLAAMGGIRAAALAREGFTGPPTAIEGARGFLRAFVAEPRPDELLHGLGDEWRLIGLALKRFCVCAGIQAPLAALQLLRARGLTAADVEELEIGIDPVTLAHVGAIGPAPTDMAGAQFSVQHAAAVHLVLGGNDPSHYAQVEAERFASPAIRQLAERVRTTVDGQAEAAFPHRLLAQVTVRCRDGRTLRQRAEAPGSPGAPLTPDEVDAKFHRLADPVLGPDVAAAVRAAVRGLADDRPAHTVLHPLKELYR